MIQNYCVLLNIEITIDFLPLELGFLKGNDGLNVAEICSGQQDDQKMLKHMSSSSTQNRGRLC